ncbi:MAG: hypothetical protein AAF515_12215 [Pseudomonadota bacterium]
MQLSGLFAVEVYAYAVMDNHFHLIVHYDPQEAEKWSTEEVIRRWLAACPPAANDRKHAEAKRLAEESLMRENKELLESRRSKLGDLSVFMKLLKQPIARRANREDECTGHFFEQRFHSSALLDENAILAAMAYVDLNPVRAGAAISLATSKHSSAKYREGQTRSHNRGRLTPLASGFETSTRLNCSSAEYARRLHALASEYLSKNPEKPTTWFARLHVIARKQRAFGAKKALTAWLAERGFQIREVALP